MGLDGIGDFKVRPLHEVPSNSSLSTLEDDIELSDVQFAQSIILAEEAALNGKDEFKTVERLYDLNSTSLSLSLARTRLLKSRCLSGIHNFTKHMLERRVGKEGRTCHVPK